MLFGADTHQVWAQHAMVAAVAVGLACSLLSVIVVLRRMAFIGQGISHAGFGGVGLAAFCGLTGLAQDAVVLAVCLAAAIGIALLARRRIGFDAAIGILLVVAMALGVLLQNLRIAFVQYEWYRNLFGAGAYTTPWEQILFGSPWTVGAAGMWSAVVMAAAVLAIGALLFKAWVFYTFDPTVGRVYGVPMRFMEYLLLILLALVIVVSIRLVGFILVSALLVVPGAAALQLSRRLGAVLGLSAAVGLGGAAGGLVLALEAGNLSPGACVVAVLFVILVMSILFGKRVRRISS